LIEDKIEEIEELEKYVEEEEDDDGAWEEGKKEVEEGFQIIENACELMFVVIVIALASFLFSSIQNSC
jgi:hypothetical protein